jgi:hypothetical protein
MWKHSQLDAITVSNCNCVCSISGNSYGGSVAGSVFKQAYAIAKFFLATN